MTDHSDLKALAEQATPGERATDGDLVTVDYPEGSVLLLCQMAVRLAPDGAAEREADARFLAAADPQTVLALLSDLSSKEAEIERLKDDNEAYRRTNLFLADEDFRKRMTDAQAQYQEGFEDGRHVPLTVEDIRAGKHHDTWEERLDSAHKSLQTATEALKDLRICAELLMNNSDPGVSEGRRKVYDKDFSLLRASVIAADRALKQIESGAPLEIGEVE